MLSPGEQKSFEERFALIRTLEKDRLIPEKQAFSLTIQDAGIGDFFVCAGQTFFIRQISTYQETSEDYNKILDYQTHELTCLCIDTGETVYFEWEYDDELEITRTIKRITFRDLTDDAGKDVDAGDLDEIVEEEDVLIYQGKKFWYGDDWAALYIRDEKEGKKEPVYFYEFEDKNNSLYLTVERWAESSYNEQARNDYQIFISQPLNFGQITLISKGAK